MHYQIKLTQLQDVMNSKKLTDDLNLLDCSRPCTGSASILLASEEMAKKNTDMPNLDNWYWSKNNFCRIYKKYII